MNIPVQLIILIVPSLVYAAVRRRHREGWRAILVKLGWSGCSPVYFVWGLGLAAVLGGLAWLATRSIPAEVFTSPRVSSASYAGWTRSATTFLRAWGQEAIATTLGEEVFFRGLLGGWLIRRFGFAVGNAAQALLFLLPHLLLLAISLRLWPLVLLQLLAGWILGWLRGRSGSILPGWLTHSLVNALGAFAAMT